MLAVTYYGAATEEFDKYVKEHVACDQSMAVRHDSSFAEHVTRVPPILQDNVKIRDAHHHCGVFVSDDKAIEFMQDILSKSNLHNTGGGTILIIPLQSNKLKTPGLSIPKSKKLFMIAFLRVLNSNWCSLSDLSELNEYTHNKALDVGGTIYPVGTFTKFSSPAFWRAHFIDYSKRCKIKKQTDPETLLTPSLRLADSCRAKL